MKCISYKEADFRENYRKYLERRISLQQNVYSQENTICIAVEGDESLFFREMHLTNAGEKSYCSLSSEYMNEMVISYEDNYYEDGYPDYDYVDGLFS